LSPVVIKNMQTTAAAVSQGDIKWQVGLSLSHSIA